jgi:hypothetical protein
MKGEESASRSHCFHIDRFGPGAQGKRADAAVAVLPELRVRSCRRQLDRILGQRRVDLVLQLPDIFLFQGIACRKKRTHLRTVQRGAPSGRFPLVLKFGRPPYSIQMYARRHDQPKQTDLEGSLFPRCDPAPSSVSDHCCTSSASRTCIPAATGLVAVVMTYS